MSTARMMQTEPPERPELQALLERAKTTVVTDEELRVQCASFVYGNAPRDSRITKESAVRAVMRMRLVEVAP